MNLLKVLIEWMRGRPLGAPHDAETLNVNHFRKIHNIKGKYSTCATIGYWWECPRCQQQITEPQYFKTIACSRCGLKYYRWPDDITVWN